MKTDMTQFKTKRQLAAYIERRKKDVEIYGNHVRDARRNVDNMIDSYYSQLAEIGSMRKYLEHCELPDLTEDEQRRESVLAGWRTWFTTNVPRPWAVTGHCWSCGTDLTVGWSPEGAEQDGPPTGCPKCHRSFVS